MIRPDFDPLLLLTSPEYGLTFCFTTPVFLLGLVFFYPHVNQFAYRATAFCGLLYGLFNLSQWFSPDTRWMGFLHLPLLIISLYAFFLPRFDKQPSGDAFLEGATSPHLKGVSHELQTCLENVCHPDHAHTDILLNAFRLASGDASANPFQGDSHPPFPGAGG
jgi:hypothetical protein